MSSSNFADEIGVQRSRISHILSGRNNPSLDIVQKILERWPDINAEWLLLGLGSMHKEEKKDTNSVIGEQDLFSVPSKEPIKEVKKDIIKEDEEELLFQSEIDGPKGIDSEAIKKPEQSPANDKTVEKVIIFYTDQTFKTYNPS